MEVDVVDGLVRGLAVVLEDVVVGGASGLDDGAADAREGAPEGGSGVVGELIRVCPRERGMMSRKARTRASS